MPCVFELRSRRASFCAGHPNSMTVLARSYSMETVFRALKISHVERRFLFGPVIRTALAVVIGACGAKRSSCEYLISHFGEITILGIPSLATNCARVTPPSRAELLAPQRLWTSGPVTSASSDRLVRVADVFGIALSERELAIQLFNAGVLARKALSISVIFPSHDSESVIFTSFVA